MAAYKVKIPVSVIQLLSLCLDLGYYKRNIAPFFWNEYVCIGLSEMDYIIYHTPSTHALILGNTI